MTDHRSKRAAVVTGASRGLGLGIATALAAAGHPVVLVARDPDALERASVLIDGETVVHPADVADERAVAGLAALVGERFGHAGVLVNAAGAPPVMIEPDALTWDEWRTPIDVDVRGVFNTVRAFAGLVTPDATVVNVSSGAVVAGSALHTSFSPGQAALLSLSRCLAAWLAPRGVTTHCVCPDLTLAGGIGRAGATAFGAQAGMSAGAWVERRSGAHTLTAEGAGAGVVELLGHRTGGDWLLGADGLRAWRPLAMPG